MRGMAMDWPLCRLPVIVRIRGRKEKCAYSVLFSQKLIGVSSIYKPPPFSGEGVITAIVTALTT
jgi:hypothetical protein